MEPSEMGEFSKQMQESGEGSLRYVSLLISVLAVLVAMVTVLGHREHTEAILLQSRAADQWNEYQSRRLRVQQLTVASDTLKLMPGTDKAAVSATVAEYHEHIAKWAGELKEDQDKAHELEDEVTRAESKAARFDLGEALLQISVVLASITLLTRLSRFAVAALVLGGLGVVIAASAFLLH
jgi:Domain of unknown function (DUF4337)